MTAEEYSRGMPLSKDQAEDLEVEIKEGDLRSMTILTADALTFHLGDTALLEHRKWLVLRAENQGNRNVLRNVVLLAAHTEDLKMTDF